MKNVNSRFLGHPVLIVAAIAFAARTENANAAPVQLDAHCTPQLRGIDQKLYDKAHDSTAALRQFTWIRRGFLSNGTAETANRVGQIDAARDRCLESRPK